MTDAEGNTSEFSDSQEIDSDSDLDGVGDKAENQAAPDGDGNGDDIPTASNPRSSPARMPRDDASPWQAIREFRPCSLDPQRPLCFRRTVRNLKVSGSVSPPRSQPP